MDGQDELTIYLRQPTAITSAAPTARRLSQLGSQRNKSGGGTGGEDSETISDKIEIDSDNIETPPATRRLFSPPKDIAKVADKDIVVSGSNNKRDNNNTTTIDIGTDLGSGEKLFLLLRIIFIRDKIKGVSGCENSKSLL